jgi:hypothetical protein
MDLERIFHICKTWNARPDKPFHIVCKGGAHLSYKIGTPLNDIDFTLFTNRFENIPLEYIRMLCDALLPGNEITGNERLYHVSIGGKVWMDLVVVNEAYLQEEANDASFVYYACTKQGKTMRDFFQSLYTQNKLFPDLMFELYQCEAGYELYSRVVQQIYAGLRPIDHLVLYEHKRDTYFAKNHAIRRLLEQIDLGLDDHDASDELIGGKKRRMKRKRTKKKY